MVERLKRKVTLRQTAEEKLGSVYDAFLNKTRKLLLRLTFAMAMANKISPKVLVKHFDKEAVNIYAKKFNEELKKAGDKKAKDRSKTGPK